MDLQANMGTCGAGISTAMGQVLCFHVPSAQKTQFTGEGNSWKNHVKKLRGRETIYLAGLEAVGTTSANIPVCVPPILAGWCTSGVVKGSRDRGRSVEIRAEGLGSKPCCYSHLWLALGGACSPMPSIRSFNNCFPPTAAFCIHEGPSYIHTGIYWAAIRATLRKVSTAYP